ncbi:MAG: YaiI/YqxD family protein [Patescibacteria group bacterium]
MRILVDADAFPQMLCDVLFRAAERERVKVLMVSNRRCRLPDSPYLESVVSADGFNTADDRIVELICSGDLVITADIPLADRALTRGAQALNPRGELYTDANIKNRLAMRNLMDELRVSGEITGGPSAFSVKNREAFANQLNRILCKVRKAGC